VTWDPDLYLKFKQQRFLPFDDLVENIRPAPGMKVVDLGCGTGQLSKKLAATLPDCRVLGIDNSESMLEHAAEFASQHLMFERCSVEDMLKRDDTWDLLFSNAALHWIPEHEQLFKGLFRKLNPGGQLAIQMPSNHGHPVQLAVQELAGEKPYRSALQDWVRYSPVLEIHQYGELLSALQAEQIAVIERVYLHHLTGSEAVTEWTKGTVLRPYLSRLGDMAEAFVGDFGRKIDAIFGPGPVCYSFRRTFVWASRPAQQD
jgi:trans-aconitate 2-methyltransferase